MAVDVLCHKGALGDHRQFFGAEILQYGARQLRADALSFVFFGNLGVRQDDESLRLDVFPKMRNIRELNGLREKRSLLPIP